MQFLNSFHQQKSQTDNQTDTKFHRKDARPPKFCLVEIESISAKYGYYLRLLNKSVITNKRNKTQTTCYIN